MDGILPQSPPPGDLRRKRRRQSSISADSPRELGHMRPGRGSRPTSFVGSGSGIHFVRTVRNAFARNSLRSNSNGEGIDDELVPGEDDQLQSQSPSSTLWRADEVLFNVGIDGEREEREINLGFEDLVFHTRSYFDLWHPPFPFLHAPTVLEIFEKISVTGLGRLKYTDFVIARSIMSIALADKRQMPKGKPCLVPVEMVFNTIDDAISCLLPLLIQPSTVASLQAVVSIQVFLISMLRLNAASRAGGVIVRMAYHLGLHRCPTRFEQFSTADVDMRRRLFWSIYCLERYLSQSLGLPLDIKDDDIDVCYPSNELHPSSREKAKDSDGLRHDPRLLLLPTFLAKHGQIKGLILELRNKSVLHSRTEPDEVAHVDAEISRWWNEAQDLLDSSFTVSMSSLSGVQHPDLLKSSHKLLLLVQKHESVILLNRPVITSGYKTSAFAAAMQKCIGASKAIISNTYRHLSEGMTAVDADGGKIHSPLFWPGFTWCVWMSGLILLYAAAEGHYSSDVAQREADRCVAILENLSLRGNFWPGACAAAVKELQLSLHGKIMTSPTLTTGIGAVPGADSETRRPNSSQRLTGSGTVILPQQVERQRLRNRLEENEIVARNNGPETHDDGTRFFSSHPSSSHPPLDQSPKSATSTLAPQSLDASDADTSRPHAPHSQAPTMNAGSSSQLPAFVTTNPNPNLWSDTPVTSESFDDIFQLMDVSYLMSEGIGDGASGMSGWEFGMNGMGIGMGMGAFGSINGVNGSVTQMLQRGNSNGRGQPEPDPGGGGGGR